jgi:hypothetical protein
VGVRSPHVSKGSMLTRFDVEPLLTCGLPTLLELLPTLILRNHLNRLKDSLKLQSSGRNFAPGGVPDGTRGKRTTRGPRSPRMRATAGLSTNSQGSVRAAASRPSRLSVPALTWFNCLEVASHLSFPHNPLRKGSPLSRTYGRYTYNPFVTPSRGVDLICDEKERKCRGNADIS